VENEDIKLDMMFMASLVHDLIKVGRLKQKDAISKDLFAVINIKAVYIFSLHKACNYLRGVGCMMKNIFA